METEVWEYSRLCTCNASWVTKYNKVIAGSGDFGIDQYVSWCLPVDDFRLDTIWSKYVDFCKPQANEVRARFDLLTSFCQGNRSVDEWYNAVQAQVCLLNTDKKLLTSCIVTSFSFSWRMRNLCLKPSMTVA